MATGDRINIADKETLDNVNRDVGSSLSKLNDIDIKLGNPNSSETITSLLESIASNSQSHPTEITRAQNFFVGGSVYPASSTANVLNVTGSGYLYLALANNIPYSSTTPNPSGVLQINVDGVNIINRNIADYQGYQGDSSGIIHTDYIRTNPLIFSNNINHDILSSPASSIVGFSNTTVGVTVVPIPVRFNSSLRITLGNTNLSTGVSYIYLLD